MTDSERQQLHTILDHHDHAMGAFREANLAFDDAIESMQVAITGMRDTLSAVASANRAQGHAIESLQAANRAALELLNRDTP